MPVNTAARIRDVLTVFRKDKVIDAAEQRALVELARGANGKLTAGGKNALIEAHNSEKFTSTTVKGRLTATLLDAGVSANKLDVARSADLSKFDRLGDARKLDALFATHREDTTDPWGNPDQNVWRTLRPEFRAVDIQPRQLSGAVGAAAAKLLADAKQGHKELLADWNEYDRDAGRDRHPNSIDKPTLSALVKNGETYGYLLDFTDKQSESRTRRIFDAKLTLIGDVHDTFADG